MCEFKLPQKATTILVLTTPGFPKVVSTTYLLIHVEMNNIDSEVSHGHRVVATIFANHETAEHPGVLDNNCILDFTKLFNTHFPGSSITSYRYLDSRVAEVSIRYGHGPLIDLVAIRTHEAITSFQEANHAQVIFQRETVFRRYKRLAVFDMDSTLIQQEVIDEIARKLGVEEQVAAITERAMNGEIDFTASLRERCALLKGVPTTVFEDLRTVVTLSPGAADLVAALKQLGFKTAVLSGGFHPLTSWLAGRLGLDYFWANHLVASADGQTLTGELAGDIVNAERKRELVVKIAQDENIRLEQVLTVGDGANDLLMLGIAGLGLAFNAKARVRQAAPASLNSRSMTDILYLLGLTGADIRQLTAGEAESIR